MRKWLAVMTLLPTLGVFGCQDRGPTEVTADVPFFAKANFAEISGVLALDGIGTCTNWGLTAGGIYQERDCETHYTATGAYLAEGWLLEKASFNFETGTGNVSGPLDLTVTEYLGIPVDGTLAGQVTFRCEGYWCTTNFVLQGGGDLDGLKLKTQAAGWFDFPTSFAYTATVVDPFGR